jgi:RNA polymerase sigma factor (sigma-70 family)
MVTEKKPLGHLSDVLRQLSRYRRVVRVYLDCSHDDADAIILDAVEKVYRVVDADFLNGDNASFLRYFNRSLVNTTIDAQRKSVYLKSKEVSEVNSPEYPESYLENCGGTFEEEYHDPYQETLGKNKILLIRRLRYLLPRHKRKVLLLRVKGLEYHDISTLTGLNLNTVKTQLLRTRQILSRDPILKDLISQLELPNLLL